jgi:putative spermidine/putrescine transport system permease protein
MNTIPRSPLVRHWALVPAVVFLLAVFVLPVAQLLWLSAVDGEGRPSLQHFRRLFETALYLRVLGTTFQIAAWTTLACLLVGYPIAYLLATSTMSVRSKLLIAVMMPFWTSVLVRTFAWTVILGRNGVLNQWMQSLGFAEQPLELMYTLTSVLVGMTHALMPMAVLTMLAVMQNIESNLSRAAATLGANASHRFWRIYFPLSLPGVAAAGLLTFITAIGFFVTPMLLGSPRQSMIAQVIVAQVDEMLDWGFAGAVALLLLVASIAVFWVFDRVLGMAALTGEARAPGTAGGGFLARAGGAAGRRFTAGMSWICAWIGDAFARLLPARNGKRGDGRPILWLVGLAGITFLAVPSFFLVPMSFTSGSVMEWPPRGFSLQWYQAYIESPVWQQATFRSLLVGLATALLSVVIGVPAAFVLARHQVRARWGVMVLLLLPMVMPHIIVALALFYPFSRLGLVGTGLGLTLGHAVFALPYVVITVMAVLRNYDTRLDHAAYTLGASRLVTFRRVTFPIIRAGIVTSFVFGFVKSFDELTVALFISGGASTTLPRQLWSDAQLNVTPTLAAVSTVILALVTAVILAVEFMAKGRARA